MHEWNSKGFYSKTQECSIKVQAAAQSATSNQAQNKKMVALNQAHHKEVVVLTKTSRLHGFVDEKDNLHNYLLRLKKYAIVGGWQQDTNNSGYIPWYNCDPDNVRIMTSCERLFYRGTISLSLTLQEP